MRKGFNTYFMWLRLLIILSVIGIAEYYSFVVVRSAIRTFPSGWKMGITIVYLLLTVLTWMGLLLFRVINWATLPHLLRNIYIGFTIGFFVGKILILVVMLIDDLRRLFFWIASLFYSGGTSATENVTPANGIPRSVFLSRLALLLGVGALTSFVYGISNRYNYKIHRVKLKFANLPAAFRGMKVVQISDIHSGSFDSHSAVAQGVQKIIDEKPDMVLFTGDLVNNKADEVDGYQEIFARIKAPMGVYSTLGNHDYGDYVAWPDRTPAIHAKEKKEGYHIFSPMQAANLERLKGIHAAMGWRLLMNEHVELKRGDDIIALIGIENWGAKAGFPKYGRMDLAYAGLPEKKIPFQILMSHDPSHWDAQVRTQYPNIDLTLSGHTHGMQFGVDIPGFKWSPVQYLYKRWAGLYNVGKQFLYVNRGFGFLGYPGRVGILPEITVLEFV